MGRLKLKPKHAHQSQLANHQNLAELRHSIVHADSRAGWNYRRDRAVVDEYRGTFGDVDLTDEQLKDAIKKAIQQVKWYDEMMLAK
jgi:hypothetical protein